MVLNFDRPRFVPAYSTPPLHIYVLTVLIFAARLDRPGTFIQDLAFS